MHDIIVNFTHDEHKELQLILGEHVRITRDSVWRYVGANYTQSENTTNKQRFNMAKNLLDKVNTAVKIT